MKREYKKPLLVVHGDMAIDTQAASCNNSDDAIGSNNAYPNPTASGGVSPCL